jgi:hypothetical protein
LRKDAGVGGEQAEGTIELGQGRVRFGRHIRFSENEASA